MALKRKREGEREGWPPDLCEQLQKRSFCPITLRKEEAELLFQLDQQARAMFESQEALETLKPLHVFASEEARTSHCTEEDLTFVGLKRLKQRAIFRVRRTGSALAMPWPSTTALSAAAIPVLEFMEDLAEQLLRAALHHADLSPDAGPLVRHCSLANRIARLNPHCVDSSPLDLFFYPNDAALQHVPNCTPHYDPGFLAIAVASADPGFRVWDTASREWVSGAAGGAGPCKRALQDAIVFVGESLAHVTRGRFPACRHAVDRHSSARLGIVYEVQALGGKALGDGGAGGGAESGGADGVEGECVYTGGMAMRGMEGLCAVQVVVFRCSCERGSAGGEGEPACRSGLGEVRVRGVAAVGAGGGGGEGKERPGGAEAEEERARAAEMDCQGGRGEEAGAGAERGESKGRDRSAAIAEADRRSGSGGGSVGGGGGSCAGGGRGAEEGGGVDLSDEEEDEEDEEDEEGAGFRLPVARPRCGQQRCARCRCRRESERGLAAEAGGVRDACGVEWGPWALGLLERVALDCERLSLELLPPDASPPRGLAV